MIIAKLMDTTNRYMMSRYRDMEGRLILEDGMLFLNGAVKYIKTSLIESYEVIDNTLVARTLNSTYTFEILEGIEHVEPMMKHLASMEQIDSIKTLNEEEHKDYHCKTISGKYSTVMLPAPMNREEALTYIETNHVIAQNSEQAVYILTEENE